MTASNYTVFYARHVDSFKFGSTAWTSTQWTSTGAALDTTFGTNNATALLDIVGARDANSPVKSEAFAKDIKVTGNERDFTEINLLGEDTGGAQNQELEEKPVSKLVITATLMYRNNVPLSIFNDTTTACLVQMDNAEGASTGLLNVAFNNIKVLQVGELSLDAEGHMTQQIKFTCLGGTTASPIAVTQSAPSETWSRVYGGDYAEEVQLS